MKVGFTGTRKGMTETQKATFLAVMGDILHPTEFHHGDCVGADDEAATLVHNNFPRARIVCHPPVDTTHRAYSRSHEPEDELPPLTHFARNRAIVDATLVLVACPCDMAEQPRGGTWYTVRYARKLGRRILTIWPDGVLRDVDGAP